MNRAATWHKTNERPSMCRIEFRCIGLVHDCAFFKSLPARPMCCRFALPSGQCASRDAVRYAVQQAMQAAGSVLRAAAEKKQEEKKGMVQ